MELIILIKKVNSIEIGNCFFNILVANILGIGINTILKMSGIDSLITVIMGFICSFIFIYIFNIIFNYEKDVGLKKKLELLCGKYMGFIIVVILCSLYFIASTILSYDINNFIVSQFLSETPIIIIELLFLLLVTYINSKGIETILRVSTLIFFINIFLIFIAILGQIDKFDISNFKPILNNGCIPVLKSLIYLISFMITPIFLLLIIPKNNIVDYNKTKKNIIIYNILGFVFTGFVVFFTIGVLGNDLACIYEYPAYMILKRISLFGCLDRIENIIIIQWLFQVFIAISTIVYFISIMSRIKHCFITLAILIVNILCFRNSTFFNYLVTTYYPYIGISIISIFVIISIIIKTKKKA